MRALKRGGLILVLALAIVYAGDFLSVRVPIPPSRKALGAVTIQPYYAIGLKNKRTEFDFDVPPETDTCVNSLFPHLGYNPCWYLERHKQKRIDE